jgi:hypothetical protein
VNGRSTIFSSSDGTNWTKKDLGTDEFLYGIAYGNNTFVAVGGSYDWLSDSFTGSVLTSTDGQNWIKQSLIGMEFLNGTAFGNNIFLAVGERGSIISSTDGITWEQKAHSISPNLRNTIYSNNTFFALGVSGTILQSDAIINDVPEGYWAEDYINLLFQYRITLGCGDGNFCPLDDLTRGQMAALIVRARYGESFSYTTTPYFSDIPATNTFFKYVQKLKDDGITALSGTYGVDNYVTRGQMAAFIIRAKFGENFSYTTTPYFSDVPSTHNFFKYVQKVKDVGITTVTGNYGVDNMVPRDQMAAFLARAFLGME